MLQVNGILLLRSAHCRVLQAVLGTGSHYSSSNQCMSGTVMYLQHFVCYANFHSIRIVSSNIRYGHVETFFFLFSSFYLSWVIQLGLKLYKLLLKVTARNLNLQSPVNCK